MNDAVGGNYFLPCDREMLFAAGTSVNYGVGMLWCGLLVFMAVFILLALVVRFKLSSVYLGALKGSMFEVVATFTKTRNFLGVFSCVVPTIFLFCIYGIHLL